MRRRVVRRRVKVREVMCIVDCVGFRMVWCCGKRNGDGLMAREVRS